MPWTNNRTIDALRQTYNAAVSAHQAADRALLDARMTGQTPTPRMLEAEAKAREELTQARDRLLAAMTDAINGHAAAELSSAPPQTGHSG